MKLSGIPALAASLFLLEVTGIIALNLEDIVVELNEIHQFRTILYFITDLDDESRTLVPEKISPNIDNIPKLVVDHTFEGVSLKGQFGSNVLSLAFITLSNKEVALEVLRRTLKGNLLSPIVFHFLTDTLSKDDLNQFVAELRDEMMFNSLVLVNNRLFTFNLYPSTTIREVASTESLKLALAEKFSNLHGLDVRVVRITDISTSVQYVDENGNLQYGGIFMKTILAFIKKYNGTFVEHLDIPRGFENLEKYLANGAFEIFTMNSLGYGGEEYMSYQLPLHTTCLILPYQKELPRVFYLMLPFQVPTWFLLGFGTFTLFFVILIIEALYGRNTDSLRTFQNAFFEVWRITTQQLNSRPELEVNRWVVVVHLLAIVQFMLILSLYQSGLSSFYTKSIPTRQIDTPDDLEMSNYKVLVHERTLYHLQHFGGFPPNVVENFAPDEGSIDTNLVELDPNYGYLPRPEYVDVLIGLEQSSLRQFHFSKICARREPYSIMIGTRFPFRSLLSEVILRLADAGVMDKWNKDIFYESGKAGCLKVKVIYESPLRPLKVDELYGIWIIYAIGMSVCIIVFLIEKFWKTIVHFFERIFKRKFNIKLF
ncbi:unnamed protein product [Hermetia illucens]|uniref:Ionotropic receptor n=1 Tax=Hermetia illucens TaxID=343691 RepID=A0A7R8UTY0_HERIL|nr:uncharacterized protein LOC119656325 [Hermetia illucens]CAD7086967.1 unnamed protein product [Hermetia illucens]